MTIDEAIQVLQKFKEEGASGGTLVTVDGYEGGVTTLNLERISLIEVVLNYNTASYYGEHEDKSYVCSSALETGEYQTATVLNLSRS